MKARAIGQMITKITLSNPTVTKSATGGTTSAYTPFAVLFCQYTQDSSFFQNNEGENTLQESGTFIFRNSTSLATLSNLTIITKNGVSFRITGMQRLDEKNFYIQLKGQAIKNTIPVQN